ncbi:MAG TPA: hypothetical protein VF039_11325 [Longimicrobiales bacterium]
MSDTIRRTYARAALATLLLFPAAACGDGGSTGPEDTDPVVTVSGVADGGSYEPPVTITIGVAPGTYSATLNGATFISGSTVTQPGAYALVVNARNGTARTTEEIGFTVSPPAGGDDFLIIRLFDLRLGSYGAPGDAILITDSSSAGVTHALIDAGARTIGSTVEEGYVRTRLTQLGVDTLRFMQLTHAHTDHFAGMDEILGSAIHVQDFIYNGQTRTLSSYVSLIDYAETQADTAYALTANRSLVLGGGPVATSVTMIAPLTTYLGDPNTDEMNDGSIGTLIEHGGFRIFLAGDGEDEANARWQNSFATLSGDVDVLKVGHHGANNATQTWWLSHSSFDMAVISANGTTHPRIAALANLHAIDEDVYCTNVHGEIRIVVDGAGNYTWSLEKNAASPCVAGSDATT